MGDGGGVCGEGVVPGRGPSKQGDCNIGRKRGPSRGGPQCCLSILTDANVSIFLNLSVHFEKVQCHLFDLRYSLCHVGNICSHVYRLNVAC